jgi:hypothetical protein
MLCREQALDEQNIKVYLYTANHNRLEEIPFMEAREELVGDFADLYYNARRGPV